MVRLKFYNVRDKQEHEGDLMANIESVIILGTVASQQLLHHILILDNMAWLHGISCMRLLFIILDTNAVGLRTQHGCSSSP